MPEHLPIKNAEQIADNQPKNGKNLVNLLYNNDVKIFRDHEVLFSYFDRYHIPRSWLNSGGNFLVVLEEWGGDPTGISLVKRT